LGELGVARVSVGPAITQAALGATHRAAIQLLEHGTYGVPEESLSFADANGMFAAQTPLMRE
jgi:2-methylisocitrate lyase-like PEP mutase family enzyme